MRKEQVYELRTLFQRILSDYRDDVGGFLKEGNKHSCRATKIQNSVKRGVEICNSDIMKKEPLKIKK